VAGTAAVAARQQHRRQQQQHGGGGQLGGGGGSSAEARLWSRQQRFKKCSGSAAAAAAAQRRQRQRSSGRQLGGGGGSLAAAAWQLHGHGGRLLLVDCCFFYPHHCCCQRCLCPHRSGGHTLERGKTGFRILCCYKHKLLLLKKCFQVFNFVLLMNNVFILCCSRISIFGSKPGLLRHRKNKKWTTPSENQAFCAALYLSFWSPESANFGQ
jgi:hypothetical protein